MTIPSKPGAYWSLWCGSLLVLFFVPFNLEGHVNSIGQWTDRTDRCVYQGNELLWGQANSNLYEVNHSTVLLHT